MKQAAKQAILQNFSGKWPDTGNESNLIGEVHKFLINFEYF